MQPVTIYSSHFCPFCFRAKQLLDTKAVSYEEISVDGNPEKRAIMRSKAGKNSVPQIWIGETHVGGCDDLYRLNSEGKLDELLASA